MDGPDGRPLAVLTRNGYGSIVLNTERVMFVNIDFPEHAGDGGKSLFKGLFGRKQKSADGEDKTGPARPSTTSSPPIPPGACGSIAPLPA